MPNDKNILYADGLEDAFIGIIHSKGSQPKACYDYDKCINVFKSRDGMTHEEAVDFFHYNVSDAYVGEYTPAFLVKDIKND
tara:strand:+ start:13 stop:255 length:243 start_codon:yes stop_codon:yes gene_type:complete